ncbi:hypothetical protein E1B28_011812 [Marasmius oreades]|uniref:Uncharacterized protein n=1 Tax=Marasmius oreades TaxID=181124 RepID=A0A9P7RUX2_9AGAR|nr:uncharacterized protein E1B28_011812 [Marasmius oreades]KAG7090209.1 hypothetical protein E1B28_011812 [Marasmius oreades]
MLLFGKLVLGQIEILKERLHDVQTANYGSVLGSGRAGAVHVVDHGRYFSVDHKRRLDEIRTAYEPYHAPAHMFDVDSTAFAKMDEPWRFLHGYH